MGGATLHQPQRKDEPVPPELAGHPDARILVIDDSQTATQLLESLLQTAGYSQVYVLTSSQLAESTFHTWMPDLVLLDLHMPPPDGMQLLRRLCHERPERDRVPFIMLTADGSPEMRDRALELGALDFITKPLEPTEVLYKIRNVVAIRLMQVALEERNQDLEIRVAERTAALESSHYEMLERLARAAELRDDETGEHTYRVGRTAGVLAKAAGLSAPECDTIARAAVLHDVGKIGIPDSILLKPAGLTPDEWVIMRRHTLIGAQLLGQGHSPLMQAAEVVAQCHHERWDGSGYPYGSVGEAIPLAARIVSLADVFDALTHVRPYREAWPVDRSLAEMAKLKGTQFDPGLTEVFLGLDNHRELV